jgi:hypothetical protein
MQHAFSLLKKMDLMHKLICSHGCFYPVLRSYEWLIENKTFVNMIHLGSRAFAEISGEIVQTTACNEQL